MLKTRERERIIREKKKKKNTVRLNISTTKDRGVSPRLVINVSFLERAWNRKKKRSAFVVCSTKQLASCTISIHFFFLFPSLFLFSTTIRFTRTLHEDECVPCSNYVRWHFRRPPLMSVG